MKRRFRTRTSWRCTTLVGKNVLVRNELTLAITYLRAYAVKEGETNTEPAPQGVAKQSELRVEQKSAWEHRRRYGE